MAWTLAFGGLNSCNRSISWTLARSGSGTKLWPSGMKIHQRTDLGELTSETQPPASHEAWRCPKIKISAPAAGFKNVEPPHEDNLPAPFYQHPPHSLHLMDWTLAIKKPMPRPAEFGALNSCNWWLEPLQFVFQHFQFCAEPFPYILLNPNWKHWLAEP